MSPPGGAVAKLGCGASALWSGDDGEPEEMESRPSVIKSVINMAVQLLTLDHYVAVFIPHLIPQLCCSHIKKSDKTRTKGKAMPGILPSGGNRYTGSGYFPRP